MARLLAIEKAGRWTGARVLAQLLGESSLQSRRNGRATRVAASERCVHTLAAVLRYAAQEFVDHEVELLLARFPGTQVREFQTECLFLGFADPSEIRTNEPGGDLKIRIVLVLRDSIFEQARDGRQKLVDMLRDERVVQSAPFCFERCIHGLSNDQVTFTLAVQCARRT